MISTVQRELKNRGPMTCLQLVTVTGQPAPELVNLLRNAVKAGSLTDLNGFYSIPKDEGPCCRTSYRWVEGTLIPEWVRALAVGVKTCEGVLVLAELNAHQRRKGWNRFVLAYIDLPLKMIVCGTTGQNVTRHVLRYVPVDASEHGAGK